MNGVSVSLDETAREVSERQVLAPGGLRVIRAVAAVTAHERPYSLSRRITGLV